MTIERTDGAVVDVDLLRPASWVVEHQLHAGQQLPIQIPELDVSGLANIHAIDACPRLAVGDGSVVTGRFITRRVEETVELELEDGSTIEGTAIHPVWSLDRNDWVPLGQLEPGELLQSEHGPVAVVAMRVHRRPQAVYNLEVHGQHVYQVGELGLLVHNACKLPVNRSAVHGHPTKHDALMKQIASGLESAGFRGVRTNQALSDGAQTLSRLRPDVQWLKNGKIHIVEIQYSNGGSNYAVQRGGEFKEILGDLLGSFNVIRVQ